MLFFKNSLILAALCAFSAFGSPVQAPEKLSKTDATCRLYILDFQGQVPFYLVDVETLPVPEQVTVDLLAFQSALAAAQERERAELQALKTPAAGGIWGLSGLVDYLSGTDRSQLPLLEARVELRETTIALVADLILLDTRFAAMRPRLVPRQRKAVLGLSEHFDDLVAEWLYLQAIDIQSSLHLLDVDLAHPEIAKSIVEGHRQNINAIGSGLAELDQAVYQPAAHAMVTPVFQAFLRAGAQTRLTEWSEFAAANQMDHSPEILKQFIPIEITTGVPLHSLGVRYKAYREILQKLFPLETISDQAILSLVRSSARGAKQGGGADMLAFNLHLMIDALESHAPSAIYNLDEFAALMDLMMETQWSVVEVATRLEQLITMASKMPVSRPVPISALSVLLHDMFKNGKTVDQSFEGFAKFYMINSARPEATRLNETSLAFLCSLNSVIDNKVEILKSVAALQDSAAWKDMRPEYASEDWVRLFIFGRHYDIHTDAMADLARRVFELRGKKMEAGRLLTILTLAIEKKYPNRDLPVAITDSNFLSDPALMEFASVPYLRTILPFQDLKQP